MKTLTPETVSAAVARLALMAFFPTDPDTRGALVWVLIDLVETEEQLEWLVRRALRLYGKWPGPAELRALYCSRWRPKDGQPCYSLVYPDGFPSDRPQPPKDARRDEAVSADPEFNRRIHEVAEQKKLNFGRRNL